MVTERELRMGKQIFESYLRKNLDYLVKTGRHIYKIEWNDNKELLDLARGIVDPHDTIDDMEDKLYFDCEFSEISDEIQMGFGQDLFHTCLDGIEYHLDKDILDEIYGDADYRFDFYEELAFDVSNVDCNTEQLKEILISETYEHCPFENDEDFSFIIIVIDYNVEH